MAPHGENHEVVSQVSKPYDNRPVQAADVLSDLIHDDHILPVGAGDSNSKRKYAGKGPESNSVELSSDTAVVSCYLSRRARSLNYSRTVRIDNMSPTHTMSTSTVSIEVAPQSGTGRRPDSAWLSQNSDFLEVHMHNPYTHTRSGHSRHAARKPEKRSSRDLAH